MTREEILDRIDGIYAYDQGCIDSGIKDDDFKGSLLDREDITELLTEILKRYLNNESYNYTIEDAASFIRWVDDELGIPY